VTRTMSGEDKEGLIEFLTSTKWEQFIDDEEVRTKVAELKLRVESLREGDGAEGGGENVPAGSKRVKLVVVGDGAVGKTSLLMAFAKKKFPTEYVPTVFENYTAQLKRGDETILLHLWDTAGQEDYDRLRTLSYPGADVVLLCFSLVAKGTYEAIREKWHPEVNHYLPKIPHVLVGTKLDLRESKTADPHASEFDPISTEEGQEMAKRIGAARYIEVSALKGKNLEELYHVAVDEVLGQTEKSSSKSGEGPAPSERKAHSKRRCIMM